MTAGTREELRSIYERHGRLTPALVVEEARPEDHPLHHRFCWDDEEAAERFRLVQAATLIRQVKVTGRALEPMELRAFLHVPGSADDDGAKALSSYVPEDEVRGDPRMQALVLAQMEREWRLLKRRWTAQQAEFLAVVRSDLDEAVGQ